MPANFPTALPGLTTNSSSSATLQDAGHTSLHNNVALEVNAIGAKIGTGASSQSATAGTVLGANGSGTSSWRQIVNADIAASAAIVYSKLSLTGSIVNADISATAAIAYSKLNLSNSIVAGDITSNAVTTAKINNGAVTADKLATGAASDSVAATQTTTSTSYTDLTTGGPAVSVTIGENELALVGLTCQLSNDTLAAKSFMGFTVSDASTVAAAEASSLILQAFVADNVIGTTAVFLVTGLTAGTNTFTAKYKVSSGTGSFGVRNLWALPL